MTPLVTPLRVTTTALAAITVSDISPEASRLAGLALALLGLGYLAACAVFPFRKCRACQGLGKHTSGLFGGIRFCRRCDASGLQLRAGRRAWNWLRSRRTH
jgi:hypothetical protein